jgi:outer membrane protein TolC
MLFSSDTLNFTLDKAVDYALVNSPEIRQLDIAYQKARTSIGQARSAFYPSLTATGYFAYLSDVPVFVLDSMMIPMGQHENYSLKVSLQQVLFAWGKVYDAYRIAGLSTDMAELNLLRKKQEVRAMVTRGFYGILVLEEMVRLSNESFNQLKRHQESVRKRYEAGLVPQFDLLRAQVQVANVKPMVIQAENGLKLARAGLRLLLGMPAGSEFMLSGDLEMTPEDFDPVQLGAFALENRIEIKNLERVENIAHLSRSLMQRSNLPTIFAGATYERTKPYGFGGSEWGSNITFNIGFQLPLFSGFKNLYQYRESCLAIKEAQLARETLEKAVALEVEQAYLSWTAAREATAAAQENVLQAEKAVEIIETRYKNGLATNLEYLDAQLASMQAKTNYLNALKDYHSALADINQATGKEE